MPATDPCHELVISMDAPAIIALLTDFGPDSPYVAQMKAIILSRLPAAKIVDITHSIRPQNIPEAAWVLADVLPAFERPTVFVVVIDPGVGTDRDIVAVPTGQHILVGPDNGVLSRCCEDNIAFRVTQKGLWRENVSATFHGRDIMAPVAAALSGGAPIDSVGPATNSLVQLPFPQPDTIAGGLQGRVEYVDSFGNLITNIHRSQLPSDVAEVAEVCLQDGRSIPLVHSYGAASPGTLVALFGSNNRLEIARVEQNAANSTNIAIHTPIIVRFDSTG